MKLVMTTHARVDRADRLVALIDYLGMDEIILETPDDKQQYATLCLTATGIIIVKSTIDNRVITAYMAKVDRVYAMYKTAGYNRIPKKVYQRIIDINRMYPFLCEM
jgi:hypothetical protein